MKERNAERREWRESEERETFEIFPHTKSLISMFGRQQFEREEIKKGEI